MCWDNVGIATSATIRWTVGVCAAAVAVAGCGSSTTPSALDTQPATATTAQSAAPAPKLGPLAVLRPRPGHTLDAETEGSVLVASLDIAGRAAPKQIVFLEADCKRPSCERLAPTDADGRFTIHATVSAPVDAPHLSLAVGYTDPASGQAPVTETVDLRVPATPIPEQPKVPSSALPDVKPLPPIPAPTGSPTPTATVVQSTTPGAGSPGARPLIVIGDSLAVGTRAPLAAALPGWPTVTNARVDRGLAEGMRVLEQTQVTAPRTILAFSLFTNNDPTDVAALRQAVLTSVARLGAHGCAIWATIHRPPVNGVSYAAANNALTTVAATLGGRVLIVPWDAQAARHPEWLAPDGVHGTTLGDQQRADLYAQAALSCSA